MADRAFSSRRASRRGRAAGLPIGLYLDLAVGVDAAGADAWAAAASRRQRRDDRRAAGHLEPQGPELGPAAAERRRAARLRLPAVRRAAARQHALRRRAAHRSRARPDAPVLDSGRRDAGGRRLCRLSVRRAARRRRAGEPAQPLPGHRRGSRHAAGRLRDSACARAGLLSYSPALFRARRAAGASSRRATIRVEALVAVSTHDLPTVCRLLVAARSRREAARRRLSRRAPSRPPRAARARTEIERR